MFENVCFPREENKFGIFFLILQNRAYLVKHSKTVCKALHAFFAIYKGISKGPKRSSETNISKKGYLPGDK